MPETTIKIASNPYLRTVDFFYLDEDWEQINSVDNPNSKLLSRDLVNGFFPFKAEEIIDKIVSEFQAGTSPITLIFEGSDDEYEELCSVCNEERYRETIHLARGERFLENARDVLPEIVNIFKSIRPLVDEFVLDKEQVSNELDKFCDVSSDMIPLCVIGNYSMGKSAFINSLIGHELLPSSDMPTTTKLFQIKRSKQRDRASIRFSLDGDRVELKFDSEGLSNEREISSIQPCAELLAALKTNQGMIPQMKESIKLINETKQTEDRPAIDYLVEVEVPFCTNDPWALSHEFVIFDMPGSNSATNKDHIEVLRKAMNGLSNGLPIYVTEYSSLDSTDNAKLYNEIKQIDAIDERFAMIVVNKADAANLPRGYFNSHDLEMILDRAIPRKLYAQGIFFVSSIMGLGAKTHGEFFNDNYSERYKELVNKYADPNEDYYKTLYRYNILPGQISKRTISESEQCPDLVLANSGLFCIEQEIALFAERYSAYNKCQQSEMLLKRIIDITSEQIAKAENDCKEHKSDLQKELESEEAKLVADLDACGEGIEQNAADSYPYEASQISKADHWFKPYSELENRERNLIQQGKEDRGFFEENDEANAAWEAIGENLGKRVGDVFTAPGFDSIGNVFAGLASDIGDAGAKREKADSTIREVEVEASERLLEEVKEEFEETLDDITKIVDKRSREYWENKSENGREKIYQLTSSSTVLSEKNRKEIEDIIIHYPALKLKANTDKIFNKSKFNTLRFFSIPLFRSTRLNLRKVSRTYNHEIELALNETKDVIRGKHESSFKEWLKTLLGQIKENITEYNPTLSRHVKLINEDERRIIELIGKRNTLERCTEDVARMIDWRE